LLKALGHISIAPFGLVEFRHFFLADAITSISKSLVDMGLIFVYFNEGYWKTREPVD